MMSETPISTACQIPKGALADDQLREMTSLLGNMTVHLWAAEPYRTKMLEWCHELGAGVVIRLDPFKPPEPGLAPLLPMVWGSGHHMRMADIADRCFFFERAAANVSVPVRAVFLNHEQPGWEIRGDNEWDVQLKLDGLYRTIREAFPKALILFYNRARLWGAGDSPFPFVPDIGELGHYGCSMYYEALMRNARSWKATAYYSEKSHSGVPTAVCLSLTGWWQKTDGSREWYNTPRNYRGRKTRAVQHARFIREHKRYIPAVFLWEQEWSWDTWLPAAKAFVEGVRG